MDLSRFLAAALVAVAIGARADDNPNHQHAHVHGAATLGIAVDRDVVTIAFESPLDSLVGFEHAPQGAAERAAVASLKSRMDAPADLFRLTPAASCALVRATAESALFDAAPTSDEHADLDASFEFRCARVDRLAAIEIGLFDAYPRLQRIAVVVATPRGQSKRLLERPARTIDLGR